ncbi:MAG TPA: serine/threonine-protein kinase [Thermoanaerobaculia bacterium]|nr:serine/threonine-protein kinase [Thermoanaerobaculia bacterium]
MQRQAERFRQVEQLFASALACPAEDRGRFLRAASGGDEALVAEVERLLLADSRAGDFVERAIEREAEAVAGEAIEALALGESLGLWRIVACLGRGGTSTVYLGERVDGQFHGRVAIKVLRPGMVTPDLADRFQRERRILSGLEHPGIARFLDGGTTPRGLPYFVMELVEGLPIDRWADAQTLSVAERIALFRQVCDAVRHAHQNLVVHRDIKPSNVLVTGDGRVKLLDFGIAKLLEDEGEGPYTVAAQRLLTPRYASPEQVLGRPITTATDVYSLGVLLYELLCGRPPYATGDASPPAVARAVIEQEPQRPSVVVRRLLSTGVEPARSIAAPRSTSPRELARSLAGDLDTIVGKAMAKEVERRYASVAELVADLDRHCAGEPVLARPATLRYHAAKFVRRHRFGSMAAALFLLATIAFSASVTSLLARTRVERDRARQVSALLSDLFELADHDPARGETITARELLDRGAERAATHLADQPETQAMVLDTLGRLYEQMGLYDRATAALVRSVALHRQLPGAERALAGSLNHLGRVRARAGDFQAAEPYFVEALELRRRVLGSDSTEVAASLNNVALVRHDLGYYADALGLYREALALDRRLSGPGHPATAVTMANVALLLHDQGEYGEAEGLYREALAIWQRHEGSEGETVAEILDYLAMTLAAQERWAEAAEDAARSLKLRLEVLGEKHRDVARGRCHLGAILRDRGEVAAAAPLLEEAERSRRELLGPDHPELAESLVELAALARAQGDLPRAESLYREAIAVYAGAFATDHPLIGLPIAGLGLLHLERFGCATARGDLERALALLPPRTRPARLAAAGLASCGEGR